MSSLLDQIKANAIPAGTMRTAARGALPLPPAEMLEILVHLTRNPAFGEDAKMTLAGWDIPSAIKVLSDPAAPPEVLSYFWMETNRRPSLMPALIENTAVTESMLIELAATGRREMVSLLLASPRARRSPAVKEALAANPELTREESRSLQGASAATDGPAASVEDSRVAEASTAKDEGSEAAHQAWQQEHAAEIAAEEGKPFELVGQGEDEDESKGQERTEAAREPSGEPGAPGEETRPQPVADSSALLAAAALAAQPRVKAEPADTQRLTALQRIARMNAAQRVLTAFTGGRDERMILIRDGARVVQNAVLASPKLTEPEVETFAAAKNVSENVLREIARNRRFMKNYNVGRNLVNNAKCPLDLSLTLVKNLMVYDLKSLRFNKAVPETIRRVATELYREKTGPAKETKRR